MDSGKTFSGSSQFKVPSVQELVKQNPEASVPPRYIRPDQHPPFISHSSSPLQQLPVIDLQLLLSSSSSSNNNSFMNSELRKLDSACREWGFFQLINHGVRHSLVVRVKQGVQEFFKLPKEEKEKFEQRDGQVEGLGQAFVVSEEQKLDWADMLYATTKPTQFRKPHLLPKFPLPFREDLEEYLEELEKLAMVVFKQMANALGMKQEDMNMIFEQGKQSIRMNYYPPCPQPELVIGLCPHSDASGLTILLQAGEVEGLQVRKDGDWIPVVPLPDAFIVNVGDSLEIVTNGIYKSVEHRATVNKEKERVSIAAFHSSKMESNLGPAPSLITPENPPKYTTISLADFAKGFLSRQLLGKSYLDSLKI